MNWQETVLTDEQIVKACAVFNEECQMWCYPSLSDLTPQQIATAQAEATGNIAFKVGKEEGYDDGYAACLEEEAYTRQLEKESKEGQ